MVEMGSDICSIRLQLPHELLSTLKGKTITMKWRDLTVITLILGQLIHQSSE